MHWPASQSSPPGQSELTTQVCWQVPLVPPVQFWSPAHWLLFEQDAFDEPQTPPTHGAPPHSALLVHVHS